MIEFSNFRPESSTMSRARPAYLACRDEEICAGVEAKPCDPLVMALKVPDVLVVMQRVIPDSMIPPLHCRVQIQNSVVRLCAELRLR